MRRRTALILGGTGITGRALAAHLAQQSDWDVVSVSRAAKATSPACAIYRPISRMPPPARPCFQRFPKSLTCSMRRWSTRRHLSSNAHPMRRCSAPRLMRSPHRRSSNISVWCKAPNITGSILVPSGIRRRNPIRGTFRQTSTMTSRIIWSPPASVTPGRGPASGPT